MKNSCNTLAQHVRYVFHPYFSGKCSEYLHGLLPKMWKIQRSTHTSTFTHRNTLELSWVRIPSHENEFIIRTAIK